MHQVLKTFWAVPSSLRSGALIRGLVWQGEEFMQAVDSEYRGMWCRYCES